MKVDELGLAPGQRKYFGNKEVEKLSGGFLNEETS